MIDARNAIGTPVITDCPEFVTVNGTTYRIEAGAVSFEAGAFRFERDETNDSSLFDRLHEFAPYYVDPSIWRRYTGEA